MQVGLRGLLTAMCALCVVVSIATLWSAAAIMAVEALTTAREDQLLTSSHQTGQQVLAYFETASKAALSMASMYNASTLKNPEEPEIQFMTDYFNNLHFLFRDAPVLDSVMIFTPRDPQVVAAMPQADQPCDTDGILLTQAFGVVVNNNTSGSMGCSDSLLSSCAPGMIQILLTGGERVPSAPGQLFMPMVQASCSEVISAASIWGEGLPGDLSELDSGIRSIGWGDRVFPAGTADEQFLLRKVYFNLIGPAWAPFGAVGGLAQRMSQSTMSVHQTVSLLEILEEVASASTSKDVLMVISAYREIVAVSDPSINVEAIDEHGALALHYADNATVVGDYLADVATRVFEMYCDQSRCDWSNAKGLIHVAGSVVALEPLNDAYAENLNLLLVSAVKESDILESAHVLNLNIAVCACVILVVLCGASFAIANYLSTPITNFSERLVAASLMKDLGTSTGRPFVSEIDSMETALNTLVAQLLEYKSFLPSSMFEADDTADNESGQMSSKSSVDGRGSAVGSSRGRGKPVQAAVSTKCALKSKSITMFCTNVRGWSEFVYGERLDEAKVVTEQSIYITVLASTLSGKGTIDRFNGDRVVISFGSVNACASSTACKLAYKALHVLTEEPAESLKKGIGAGMSKGKMLVGNSGDKTIRAFNFMGPAVNIAWKLSDIATSFCQPAGFEFLLDGPLRKDVEIEYAHMGTRQFEFGRHTYLSCA
ncbi:Adenylate cyclase 1 [Diplonema papillatum]|nr:Adenylate cyclase 1 [Diplonema papillatum]